MIDDMMELFTTKEVKKEEWTSLEFLQVLIVSGATHIPMSNKATCSKVHQETSDLMNGWVKQNTKQWMMINIPRAIIYLFILFYGSQLPFCDCWALYDDDDSNEEIKQLLKIEHYTTVSLSSTTMRIGQAHVGIMGKRIINTNVEREGNVRFVWTLKLLKVRSSYGRNFEIGIIMCDNDNNDNDIFFGISREGRCVMNPWNDDLFNPSNKPRIVRFIEDCYPYKNEKVFQKNDILEIKMYLQNENKQFDIEFHKNKQLLVEYRGFDSGVKCRLYLKMRQSGQSWQIVNFESKLLNF